MSNALANVYSFGNKLRNNLKALLTDPVNHLASQANIWAADMNRALDSPATAYRRAGGVMADDPSTVAAANREQERMTAALMGTAPGFVGMTAWHGSPHRFNKFDSSKIGTGEGAQAYGHGLYLAESPDVARTYSADRAYVGASMSGKPLPINYDDPVWIAQKTIDELGDPIKARAHLEMVSRTAAKHQSKETADAVRGAIDLLASGSVQPKGSLYKVDLPDEMIARMLDWDKPLSQQALIVDALRKSEAAGIGGASAGWRGAPSGMWNRAVASPSKTGEWLYRDIANNDPRATVETLRQLGIPGIRYLDEGSRNTALLPHFDVVRKSDGATVMQVIKGGEKRPDIAKLTASGEFELRGPVDKRTRNFVVFPGEENALRILERNGMTLADMAGQSGKIDSRLIAALGLGSAAAFAGNSLLNSGKKKMEDAKKARQQAIDRAEEK